VTYIQDLTGRPVPAGRVIRTLVDWAPGWAGMPSTVAVDSGSGAITAPEGGNTGQLKISGSTSRLAFETTSDLGVVPFAEVTWTVEGLYASNATGMAPTISIENAAGTIGVGYSQSDGDATAHLRIGQPSGTPPVTVYSQYNWGGSARLNHRNLTLQVRPPTGEVRLLEDDQVIFELPEEYWATVSNAWGLVRCRVLSNVTAASQALYLSRCLLTVAHN
jgi:hypothetical protein